MDASDYHKERRKLYPHPGHHPVNYSSNSTKMKSYSQQVEIEPSTKKKPRLDLDCKKKAPLSSLMSINCYRKNLPCFDFINGLCHRGNNCLYSHTIGKPPCHNFISNNGHCFRGDTCPFDHIENFRTRIEKTPCCNFTNGYCRKGDSCPYSHITEKPQNIVNEEENFKMAKKNAMASKVEYAVKELQTKLDVKRTTEELKAKLMAKSKLRNSNLRSKSESLENLPVAENIEETHQRQRIESNQGFREPQFDLFDIELNSQDLKEVGSNRVDEIQDDNEDIDVTLPNKPNAEQLEKTVETAENQGLIKSIDVDDDQDEIVEVPVPPKPVPEVVILENDEETEQEANGLAEVQTQAQRLAEAEEAKKLAEAAEKERQNELAIEVERQRQLEEEAAEAKQLNEIKGAERLAEAQSIAKIASEDPNKNQSLPNKSTVQDPQSVNYSMLETLQTLNEEESELFEQMQKIMERLDYIRQLRSQVLSNK